MKEIRVIGVDDAPFFKFSKGNVLIIGVVMRKKLVEGVLSNYIKVDGMDSTKKILEMVNSSKFGPQSKIIMINGIALGGFNVIDVEKLSQSFPVIIISRKKPNYKKIENALKHFEDGKERFEIIKKAGKPKKCQEIYFQNKGITDKEACKYIKEYSYYSNIPEPIRIAHIIGAGIVLGENRQRV